jgi:hypothetical protein
MSSLEKVNHVKNISQKYGSNGALCNFDGSPNPRTYSAVYLVPLKDFVARVI